METLLRREPGITDRTVGAVIGPESPARVAITDFKVDGPITVPPDLPIEEAREIMQRMAVHALLVTPEGASCPEQAVLGLLTSFDLGRSTPVPRRGSQRPVAAAGLRVCDCMTGRDDLPVVHYDSLLSLTVRDLHERFQGTGLTHLLVVELRDPAAVVARGLVSRAAISRLVRGGREMQVSSS